MRLGDETDETDGRSVAVITAVAQGVQSAAPASAKLDASHAAQLALLTARVVLLAVLAGHSLHRAAPGTSP